MVNISQSGNDILVGKPFPVRKPFRVLGKPFRVKLNIKMCTALPIYICTASLLFYGTTNEISQNLRVVSREEFTCPEMIIGEKFPRFGKIFIPGFIAVLSRPNDDARKTWNMKDRQYVDISRGFVASRFSNIKNTTM